MVYTCHARASSSGEHVTGASRRRVAAAFRASISESASVIGCGKSSDRSPWKYSVSLPLHAAARSAAPRIVTPPEREALMTVSGVLDACA